MAKTIGAVGDDIMFSSNDTPIDEFKYCNKLGGIINLDVLHILRQLKKLAANFLKK